MPLVPAAPPQPVAIISHFDYLAIDADRRRVYAAHTGSGALLIVNGDSGAVVGQVETGVLHGVAVNPETGNVYTGDGDTGTVSEVDPKAMKVVNTVDIGHPIDAIAYDPKTDRIFADEDSGTQVFVVDAKSFKLLGSVPTHGHDTEFLAVDPDEPNLYQNVPDHNEFVIINTQTMKLTKVVPTPELKDNHPLQFDAALREVVVGGHNGVISVYSPEGKKLSQASMPPNVDQCDLEQTTGVLACAGRGKLWTLQIAAGKAPKLTGVINTGHSIHTVAIDPKNHWIWTAWSSPKGDFVQAYRMKP
jgi:DNA-binding beta-propeller fold protein YncE